MALTKTERNKLKKLLHIYVVKKYKKCLKCGATKNLHASHIFSKGAHKNMEFDPDNVKALCMKCHLYWWHKEPVEAGIWFKKEFPKWYRRLNRKANPPIGKVIPKPIYDYKKIKKKIEKAIEHLD